MVAYHPSTKQLREIPNGLRTGGGRRIQVGYKNLKIFCQIGT